MWYGKIGRYEIPYTVTGGVKFTGLKKAPKFIYTDRIIGTGKG